MTHSRPPPHRRSPPGVCDPHRTASSTPEGRTAYVESDLRDTSAIIREASRTLDFGAPIALMLLIIVHLIRKG